MKSSTGAGDMIAGGGLWSFLGAERWSGMRSDVKPRTHTAAAVCAKHATHGTSYSTACVQYATL